MPYTKGKQERKKGDEPNQSFLSQTKTFISIPIIKETAKKIEENVKQNEQEEHPASCPNC